MTRGSCSSAAHLNSSSSIKPGSLLTGLGSTSLSTSAVFFVGGADETLVVSVVVYGVDVVVASETVCVFDIVAYSVDVGVGEGVVVCVSVSVCTEVDPGVSEAVAMLEETEFIVSVIRSWSRWRESFTRSSKDEVHCSPSPEKILSSLAELLDKRSVILI